jgi:hypothetical protein
MRWHGASQTSINTMLLAALTCLGLWEISVSGHDIIAISAAILTLFLFAQKGFESERAGLLILAAIALGFFGTSRVIFPFVAPLIAMLYIKQQTIRAIWFTCLALAITAAIHFWQFHINEVYEPFHLFVRAENGMGKGLAYFGLIATIMVGFAALILYKNTDKSRHLWFAACLTTPLIFVSIGELSSISWDFAKWEGANYLLPGLFTGLGYLFWRQSTPNVPISNQ